MVLNLFCEFNLPNIFAYYFQISWVNHWELTVCYGNWEKCRFSRVKSNQILTDPLDGFDLSLVFQLLIYDYAVVCIHYTLWCRDSKKKKKIMFLFSNEFFFSFCVSNRSVLLFVIQILFLQVFELAFPVRRIARVSSFTLKWNVTHSTETTTRITTKILLAFFPQINKSWNKWCSFIVGKLTLSNEQNAKINKNPLLCTRNNIFAVICWMRPRWLYFLFMSEFCFCFRKCKKFQSKK